VIIVFKTKNARHQSVSDIAMIYAAGHGVELPLVASTLSAAMAPSIAIRRRALTNSLACCVTLRMRAKLQLVSHGQIGRLRREIVTILGPLPAPHDDDRP
jgi:hypothetical protein